LIGGVIGSMLAAAGGHAVQWHGLVEKVIIPAGLSPVIAAGVATLGTFLVYLITRRVRHRAREHGFRIGQIGSASMVSLAHGSNDAQKTMGIITLALIANGTLSDGAEAPTWVIVSCALAISLGTYMGGWRVIRTLGKGLVEIESPQGMAAESSSAAVILLSSHFGYSLSTTHVATGSILGTGMGKRGAQVRWNVAGRMATAWLFTLPCSGAVGAVSYWIADGIGGNAGIIVVLAMLVGIATAIYLRSRRTAVRHDNVNVEWTGTVTSPVEEKTPVPA
jgi:PiT family inorganic phosphate transporter